MKIKSNNFKKENVNGQAALALVLLISGVVILAGLSLAFLVLSFTNATLGIRLANRALAAASAGADDALIRVVRDISFSAPGGYDVPVGNDEANVVVVNDIQGTNTVAIESTSLVRNYKRKIEVIATVDPSTGEVTVASRKQASF